ncbi:rhamnogalacturonan acetylesterase [Botryobacter ruber]|uniref:rhamnogalacturonan acetylesterase n=1 Tax=Botryobacter ruber TaxID=2171629 RepID=UPI000E0C6B54|nr:rhamnogalacturonan acetylesterase [Botryobacter ruber]
MFQFLFRKSSFGYVLLLGLLLSAACASVKTSQSAKPTLFLIGDSTVKNGRGDGAGGLWGWGSFVGEYFDTTKVNVENHALGGTSSRTFQTYGHWDKVLAKIQPGDYVMMQFGHNDSSPVNDTLRARGTIRGVGEEMEEIDNLITKKHEVVHSYGWYLRKFISDIKAKGATPIVVSPIPRNSWRDGKVNRDTNSYTQWAETVARTEGVAFINLNELVANRYDKEGEEKVRSTYFNTKDRTHPIEAGSRVNAELVVAGLKQLKNMPLAKYLNSAGKNASAM